MKGRDVNIYASKALLDQTWAQSVRVCVENGVIAQVSTGVPPMPDDVRVDALLPAMANLHSHSFQRAMAGMTEFRTHGQDSFWTWRDLMYRFLDALTPDQVAAIAQLAFMEMLKAGYASVGEFHYLHHQSDGRPYDNPAELSAQIMRAAQTTGIGLTHLPVLYTYGDVGRKPITAGQKRFCNSVDQFEDLAETCRMAARDMPCDTRIGVAPHSLRATCAEDLTRVVEGHPDGPIHMHIAEQTKEVDSVCAALGARPVEWLMQNTRVDGRWCLIHATHMTPEETEALAQSGAVAGVCPVTEANLGDGIFHASAYAQAGGAMGVGTDSNINISLSDELRLLEYAQRLKHRRRNLLAGPDQSTGQSLYLQCAQGGAQALSRNAGQIAEGRLADLVAIDTMHPRLCALADTQLVDGWVFAANDQVVTDVWAAGRHMVKSGHHVDEIAILQDFRTVMDTLTATL